MLEGSDKRYKKLIFKETVSWKTVNKFRGYQWIFYYKCIYSDKIYKNDINKYVINRNIIQKDTVSRKSK